MAKFLYLAKAILKKKAIHSQAVRWTPFIFQHNLQNDSFKKQLLGLLGLPSFLLINNEILLQLRLKQTFYFPRVELSQGFSGFQNESLYGPQTGRQGDFKDIKSPQFVHAVQIANNPMQMDEFSLDEVESVVSDFEYDEEFNNNSSQMSESLVLSWANSTADSASSINSINEKSF